MNDNNNKNNLISLVEYREKLKTKKTKKKKVVSNDKHAKIIYMDTYKKSHTFSNGIFQENQKTKTTSQKNKESEIISLSDYRKKKQKRIWKKDLFKTSVQVSAMVMVFLFLFTNMFPMVKEKQSLAQSTHWFQAPKNKGIVIKKRKRGERERDIASPNCKINSGEEENFLICKF
ncbi:MAG: hypothetical protein GDA46_02565 [Bdellovibrionales bacterium]|nr:hypothetical protein [Bdellovibrionales bacterium]